MIELHRMYNRWLRRRYGGPTWTVIPTVNPIWRCTHEIIGKFFDFRVVLFPGRTEECHIQHYIAEYERSLREAVVNLEKNESYK